MWGRVLVTGLSCFSRLVFRETERCRCSHLLLRCLKQGSFTPAASCTNLKSAMAAARGECVKAAKSACSVMAATSREFIGDPELRPWEFVGDPELRPWELLNSCLLPLTQKWSLQSGEGVKQVEKEEDLLEGDKRLSLMRVLPWRHLLVSTGQTHRDDGRVLL